MDLILGNVVGFAIGIALAVVYMNVTSRFSGIERKLDLLVKHSGIDVAKKAEEEAASLARAGKKIEAIKVYRELTNCGLAEAKTKVESLGG